VLAGCTLALVILLGSPSVAETPLLEPQDLGVLLYRQGDQFPPLELQSAVKQERSPFFSSVSEEFLVLPGARSPVRFQAKQAIVFYLRVFLNDSDPRAAFFPLRDPTRFMLVQLTTDKQERRMTLVKSGWSYTFRQVGRPMLVRLYGEQCFQLTPSEPLQPGEYAIKYLREDEDGLDTEQFDLFCFGIDP
jgi:hypothetical protein